VIAATRRTLPCGIALLVCLWGLALLAPLLPQAPAAVDLATGLTAPSPRHWLGTDPLGRDLLARLAHGARASLVVGLLATLLALAFGVPLGAWAGYRGGPVDAVVSFLADVTLAFPALLLALAVVSVSGARGILPLAVVLALSRWARIARLARGEFRRLRGREAAEAARAAGARELRIVSRHLLPEALAPILVGAAFAAAAAVLVEASLGFLGLGVAPPQTSWGSLLADARIAGPQAWWLALFPGLAIFAALLGYTLLAEGILEQLDPRRAAAGTSG
jgi:ABC-type dipeptide/oligopeptide/nickel transport system permease subunit